MELKEKITRNYLNLYSKRISRLKEKLNLKDFESRFMDSIDRGYLGFELDYDPLYMNMTNEDEAEVYTLANILISSSSLKGYVDFQIVSGHANFFPKQNLLSDVIQGNMNFMLITYTNEDVKSMNSRISHLENHLLHEKKNLIEKAIYENSIVEKIFSYQK